MTSRLHEDRRVTFLSCQYRVSLDITMWQRLSGLPYCAVTLLCSGSIMIVVIFPK